MKVMRDDLHVLTGSYVLDAISETERVMHGSSLLASSVRPGDRIGITVEPAGGTTQPTTIPVAVLPV